MSPMFKFGHPGDRYEDEPRVEPCVESNYSKVVVKWHIFIGLQETVIMALALFLQLTLRLVLPEKRRHKRALELTGVV
jgi:hypothetical protein